MPEHLRALVVILVLASAVFYLAKPVAIQVVTAETFSRWRIAWFGLTLALFLSHSFWLYALLLIIWTRFFAAREPNVVGLFFVLLFVAPPSAVEVPAFGIVDHVLVVTHYRLLTIFLLLPLAIRLVQSRNITGWGGFRTDWPVLAYLAIISALEIRDANLTSVARNMVSNIIDILIPYFAISRSLRDFRALKSAMVGFVIAAMLLSVMTLFELLKYWKLYAGVLSALGLDPWEFGGYMQRAGLLRPNVTVGNSIVLGYVIMVGFAYFLGVQSQLRNVWRLWSMAGLLLLGVIGATSRGPWVGLVVVSLVFVLTGDKKFRNLSLIFLLSVIAYVVALQFPKAKILIDMLPFVGQVEAGSVQYRADLLMQAIPVIERNLWFGSIDYLSAPELQVMRQGEGIIDIVNTFLQVLLEYGLVGIISFLLVFSRAAVGVVYGLRRGSGTKSAESSSLGRSLLAALLAVMVVIYTLSGITAVPIVYWTLFGLCAAYEQMHSFRTNGDQGIGSRA